MRIKKLIAPLIALALVVAAFTPLSPFGSQSARADTYVVATPSPAPTSSPTPGGSGNTGSVDPSQNGKYYVTVNLWNASLNQASMGNVAFDHTALVITSGGSSVIQIGTQPVEVSGYTTAITGIDGARTIKTGSFTTNTKFDGTAHTITYLKVFELTLSNVTETYLATQIQVPYTPMDVVTDMSNGYISARFKIDWSTVTNAPSGATLDPSESVSSGTSSYDADAPSANLSDSTTGIKLTADGGIVPEDATLKVTVITSGENFTKAQTALKEIGEKFNLYDISLLQKTAEIQPNGLITVTIPIPTDYDKTKVAVYRINTDGTATLIKGKVSGSNYEIQLNKLSLYALVESFETVNADVPDVGKFTDVSGHWAFESIKYAVENGLFNGTGETTFEPDSSMTRAMFVTVLSRIAKADLTTFTTGAFDDVPSGEWYSAPVAWAAKNGIVEGVGGNNFAPNQAITRQEMAVMLNNYAEFAKITLKSGSAVTFADEAEIASWAKDAVAKFAAAELLNGVGENKFAPLNTATRAEVATLLTRFDKAYTG
jgi:hypothetical protein